MMLITISYKSDVTLVHKKSDVILIISILNVTHKKL